MTQFTINLIQGSIGFNFTEEAAKDLKQEILQLIQTLKVVATSKTGITGKPTPQKTMEYRYNGEVFLEVFCNPNIYPSPYAAKILLTVKDDRIRVTSEAELTGLIEDLDRYLGI